ncbi:Mn-dependent transcriptional regulator, DtxR family [Acetitomaculum ruminis DSM 5522]|uniref:Mn-dependent transcriptional regulator, DtxR family n=1 Tax=Acetitomaculum ruminis DSM 5522 TaxID=1120918 RepID=A0A1I0YGL8_9FIRM|nr:metal-dependent transcriptional regulator [Acetitomaculum ruminis]SFB12585.1 Mn-dependent transcriptional regulator, DtxR family [Acetitomaculum ruminis DSM 5522]
MQIHESGEDYLETILILSKKLGNVRSIDIAHEMNYKKSSISVAIKNLRLNGLVKMDDNNFITLTEDGLKIAERIYERHQILTSWLVQLGVEREIAAEDACKIEHDLSNDSFEAIKNLYLQSIIK